MDMISLDSHVTGEDPNSIMSLKNSPTLDLGTVLLLAL